VLFNELSQVVKRIADEERKRRVEPAADAQPAEVLQVVDYAEDSIETDFLAQERSLIKLLLEHGHERVHLDGEYTEAEPDLLGAQIIQFIESQHYEIANPDLRAIYHHLKDRWQNGGWTLPEEWHTHPDEALVKQVIDLTTDPEVLHKWEVKNIFVPTPSQLVAKNAFEVLLYYQGHRVRKRLDELGLKLRFNETDDTQPLLEEHMELLKLKKTIDKALNRVI
jgi:hypothetical protein